MWKGGFEIHSSVHSFDYRTWQRESIHHFAHLYNNPLSLPLYGTTSIRNFRRQKYSHRESLLTFWKTHGSQCLLLSWIIYNNLSRYPFKVGNKCFVLMFLRGWVGIQEIIPWTVVNLSSLATIRAVPFSLYILNIIYVLFSCSTALL